MKISVSVSGQSEANAHTVRCFAELESETFDQSAVERLVQAARQCEMIVCRVGSEHRSADHSPSVGASPQHGARSGGGRRLATEKQVKAIRAMASRQGIQLASVLRDRFGVAELSAMSISEASTLIDELKGNLVATS